MINSTRQFKRLANLGSYAAIATALCVGYLTYTLPYQHLHTKATKNTIQSANNQTHKLTTLSEYQPIFTLNLRQNIYDPPPVVVVTKPKIQKPLPAFKLIGMLTNSAIIKINAKIIYKSINEKIGPADNSIKIIRINADNKTITVNHSSGKNIIIKVDES